MSLPDRTASLVKRILASRADRRGRDRAMRERALAGHVRAREMMQATADRCQQRREEISELLQEIAASHDAQRRLLAPLRAPRPDAPAPRPVSSAPGPQTAREVVIHRADANRARTGHVPHRGKDGGGR